jgi:tRNA (guanine37-N1)-methyltransferase
VKITILTLFPEMFKGPFDSSIIKRTIDKGLVEIEFVNIRNFGIGPHKIVDDTPYGGGKGMLLRADVLFSAIKSSKLDIKGERVVLLTPAGRKYSQEVAREFSKLTHLILICGHYEGVDARIEKYIDDEVSMGDFVLTGGEIPAMAITDSVVRLIEGTFKEGVTEDESFSPYLEYPQYTRPPVFEGQKVPDTLLSGNHKKIEEWKKGESLRVTKKLRPDLIKKAK